MPVGYTSRRSVQVSGFDDIGHLTPPCRLVSASCSSDQRFAFGFLQISSHPEHPCRSANSSPCRASRGLSPPSKCALPGAPNKKTPSFWEGVLVCCEARIRSLTMTYFHRRDAYYHWRGSVSPSCSGWEGVVPLCYGRQTKGGGPRPTGWLRLDPAFELSGVPIVLRRSAD